MSACIQQLVHGLVGDVNGFFNNKAEILRGLFVSRKQFENLIERDCNGNLSGPILNHNFHEHELDFMESFVKTFELGLNQLEEFMMKLNSIQGLLRLDECSILYYLRQLLHGPYACVAQDLATLMSGGSLNILGSVNNGIGTLGNAVRSNISNVVYGLEPFNAAVDLYNQLPGQMQQNIDDGIRTATNVFNFNMESSIFQDNTLPYIDKFPRLRVNTEYSSGFTNFAAGNLMLKDVPFFNTLRSISNDIFGVIENTLGIASFRLFQFQKRTNIFYQHGNKAFGIVNAVNRLLISLNRTEYTTTNKITQLKCQQIKTNILGTPITDNNTYRLQMETSDGIYDMYTLDGQFGSGGEGRVTPEDPISGTRRPDDIIDIFETCEEATRRGREIGCEGCHSHTSPDGEVYYMPCNSMQEYKDVIAGIKEPDCGDDECKDLDF